MEAGLDNQCRLVRAGSSAAGPQSHTLQPEAELLGTSSGQIDSKLTTGNMSSLGNWLLSPQPKHRDCD